MKRLVHIRKKRILRGSSMFCGETINEGFATYENDWITIRDLKYWINKRYKDLCFECLEKPEVQLQLLAIVEL
jgi:hypothetical protein